MEIWVVVLGVFMVAGAIAVIFQKSLRNSVVTFGVISLISALMLALMKAYDVAITEASIGAVLTTAIFFWSLKRLEEDGYRDAAAQRRPAGSPEEEYGKDYGKE